MFRIIFLIVELSQFAENSLQPQWRSMAENVCFYLKSFTEYLKRYFLSLSDIDLDILFLNKDIFYSWQQLVKAWKVWGLYVLVQKGWYLSGQYTGYWKQLRESKMKARESQLTIKDDLKRSFPNRQCLKICFSLVKSTETCRKKSLLIV